MKNRKKSRLYFIFSVLIITILLLALIIKNFRNEIIFFYSPSEINEKIMTKNRLRVGGLVVKNSVKKLDAKTIIFQITDNEKNLTIYYEGITPDLFRDGQGVVAKGKFNNEKIFEAEELLVKHDENYMPPEVKNKIKKSIL